MHFESQHVSNNEYKSVNAFDENIILTLGMFEIFHKWDGIILEHRNSDKISQPLGIYITYFYYMFIFIWHFLKWKEQQL